MSSFVYMYIINTWLSFAFFLFWDYVIQDMYCCFSLIETSHYSESICTLFLLYWRNYQSKGKFYSCNLPRRITYNKLFLVFQQPGLDFVLCGFYLRLFDVGLLLFSTKQLCILDDVTSLWRLNVKILYFILQVLSVWSLLKASLFTSSSVSGSFNGVRDKIDKKSCGCITLCVLQANVLIMTMSWIWLRRLSLWTVFIKMILVISVCNVDLGQIFEVGYFSCWNRDFPTSGKFYTLYNSKLTGLGAPSHFLEIQTFSFYVKLHYFQR